MIDSLTIRYAKLRPKIKGKWLEYLRSGNFQQCAAKMRVTNRCTSTTISHHGRGHCCLGVLAQLAVDEGFTETFRYNHRNEAPTRDVTDWAGLDRGAMKILMNMNDGDYDITACTNRPIDRVNRKNFNEIAEWIERNL